LKYQQIQWDALLLFVEIFLLLQKQKTAGRQYADNGGSKSTDEFLGVNHVCPSCKNPSQNQTNNTALIYLEPNKESR